MRRVSCMGLLLRASMDQAYHKAVIRKKELEDELAEVSLFLMLYQRFSERTETEQNEIAASANGAATPHESSVGAPRKRGNPDLIANVAEDILRAACRPMTRSELAK